MISSNNTQLKHFAKAILLEKGFLALTLYDQSQVSQQFSLELNNTLKIHLWARGVICIEPIAYVPADDIILSCGIHGDETGPIEMLDDIVSLLLRQTLTLTHRILCIIGNPYSVAVQQRFIDENLNRLFGSSHCQSSSIESNRAAVLEYCVKYFFSMPRKKVVNRVHYDFHASIRLSLYPQFLVCPYRDGKPICRSVLSFFDQCNIKTVLLSNKPSGTFSYFTQHCCGAESLTVELGSVHPFGENNKSEFALISKTLCQLISGQLMLSNFDREIKFKIYSVKKELIKKSNEFSFNIKNDVKNFQSFPAGYPIVNDVDGGYCVKSQIEKIVFPNANVPIGQRAGLMVACDEVSGYE